MLLLSLCIMRLAMCRWGITILRIVQVDARTALCLDVFIVEMVADGAP